MCKILTDQLGRDAIGPLHDELCRLLAAYRAAPTGLLEVFIEPATHFGFRLRGTCDGGTIRLVDMAIAPAFGRREIVTTVNAALAALT